MYGLLEREQPIDRLAQCVPIIEVLEYAACFGDDGDALDTTCGVSCCGTHTKKSRYLRYSASSGRWHTS